jgi:hypothetical protein
MTLGENVTFTQNTSARRSTLIKISHIHSDWVKSEAANVITVISIDILYPARIDPEGLFSWSSLQ